MSTNTEREQKIVPYLWFVGQAEEAANLYVDAFSAIGEEASIGHISRYGEATEEVSGIPQGNVLTVEFELAGQRFIALNGGPEFKFTPAISYFVACDTAEQVDSLYATLSDGGEILMPLDSYPFSERYAWIEDKYGVSWQLLLGSMAQKVTPAFLFVGEQFGKAEEAMNFYTSLFETSGIGSVSRYGPESDDEGKIAHATFTLSGQEFVVMDSGMEHNFTFNEANSLFVNCADQEEVDYFWYKLIAGGGEESMCGWLKDKYGVSWQIIPTRLLELMSDEDAAKAERVTRAMLQMRKIDVATLEAAYEGEPAPDTVSSANP